ncbi:MAG: 2-dehydropantoate 2-reductase [Desulfuromonadales bacterium]|nr:2-dehydropantoate 2-reductase [Desulfuromonadales bacterium]
MRSIEKVVIVGAGALGAFYASRFISAGTFSVAVTAEGARGKALREEGLRVNGQHFRVDVITPSQCRGPADLVIVALKDYQLADAMPLIRSQVAPETAVLAVMNGLDSEEQIAAGCGFGQVLYCVAVGIDAVRDKGQVTVTNVGRLIFGRAWNEGEDLLVSAVQQALDQADLSWETPTDMLRMLWWKFMVNVGINQASAILRAPYGVFQQSASARAVVDTLMREVITLAQAEGINLTEQDLEVWPPVLNALSPVGKTSMLQDVEAGRRTEVDMFAGKVVRLGEKYGIPVPANRIMLDLLHALEGR